MADIRSVLSQFHSKRRDKDDRPADVQKSNVRSHTPATASEIPDVFFDVILSRHKLTRPEITVLMFLYRQVYCRPNLYSSHGIGPLNSYVELSASLGISGEELVHHLHSLENQGFIETVRSGQYFVRKYFTEELDQQYGQNYDEFF